MLTASPTQSTALTGFRAFLLSILPAGMEVVQGQVNRAPEPEGNDFVVFWPVRRVRLETNQDGYSDVLFLGSIAGNTLNISSVEYGTIAIGATVFGVGVAANTVIESGSGSAWVVSGSPQTVAEETMACGAQTLVQPTELTIQVDVHGPNSADNAQVISTAFRDDYAFDYFATGPGQSSGAYPLLADDPKQIPFLNDQQQYEDRWVVEARIQVNPAVVVPQQFADALSLDIISVEATYPP
jgi:hypothetical protein